METTDKSLKEARLALLLCRPVSEILQQLTERCAHIKSDKFVAIHIVHEQISNAIQSFLEDNFMNNHTWNIRIDAEGPLEEIAAKLRYSDYLFTYDLSGRQDYARGQHSSKIKFTGVTFDVNEKYKDFGWESLVPNPHTMTFQQYLTCIQGHRLMKDKHTAIQEYNEAKQRLQAAADLVSDFDVRENYFMSDARDILKKEKP